MWSVFGGGGWAGGGVLAIAVSTMSATQRLMPCPALLLLLLQLLRLSSPPPLQPAAIKVPVQAHFGQLDTMKGFSDPDVSVGVGVCMPASTSSTRAQIHDLCQTELVCWASLRSPRSPQQSPASCNQCAFAGGRQPCHAVLCRAVVISCVCTIHHVAPPPISPSRPWSTR